MASSTIYTGLEVVELDLDVGGAETNRWSAWKVLVQALQNRKLNNGAMDESSAVRMRKVWTWQGRPEEVIANSSENNVKIQGNGYDGIKTFAKRIRGLLKMKEKKV